MQRSTSPWTPPDRVITPIIAISATMNPMISARETCREVRRGGRRRRRPRGPARVRAREARSAFDGAEHRARVDACTKSASSVRRSASAIDDGEQWGEQRTAPGQHTARRAANLRELRTRVGKRRGHRHASVGGAQSPARGAALPQDRAPAIRTRARPARRCLAVAIQLGRENALERRIPHRGAIQAERSRQASARARRRASRRGSETARSKGQRARPESGKACGRGPRRADARRRGRPARRGPRWARASASAKTRATASGDK